MRHEGEKKLWFDVESGPRLFWHNKIFVELNVLSLQSDLIASTLTHSQTVKQSWKQSAAMSCTFLIMFNESVSQCVQRVERERKSRLELRTPVRCEGLHICLSYCVN